MASKTQKASNGRATAPATQSEGQQPQDAAMIFSQDQVQALIALTDVVFKGVEEMRRCQMQAAHEARLQHEQKQAEVAHARTPADLFNLQAELMRFDMEASGKYWQQLAAICATTQAEAVSLITRSAATAGGDVAKLVAQPLPQVRTATLAAASSEPNGSGVTTDPSQAWNQWVDLGKQWSDMLYRTEAALH